MTLVSELRSPSMGITVLGVLFIYLGMWINKSEVRTHPANAVVPAILLLVLTPGLLLNIPPGSLRLQDIVKGGTPGILSSIVHAMVFALIYGILRLNFSKFY